MKPPNLTREKYIPKSSLKEKVSSTYPRSFNRSKILRMPIALYHKEISSYSEISQNIFKKRSYLGNEINKIKNFFKFVIKVINIFVNK